MKTNFLRRSVTLLTMLALVLTFVSGIAGRVEAVNPDIFDDRTDGSLTIYKYEYNGTTGDGTGEAGDLEKDPLGTTGNPGSNVNSDAGDNTTPRPLDGVEFTAYLVIKDGDFKKLYQSGEYTMPELDAYVTDGVFTGTASSTYTATTGTPWESGVAKFANLPIGLYVVVETNAPDRVTEKTKPFFVSIPMTDVNGNGWLYDVNVYPKNQTTYGKATILKQGIISRATNPLPGVTFVLQKKDTTVTPNEWVTATNEEERKAFDISTLTTDENGKITVTGLSQGTYRFVETKIGDTNKANGYIMNGAATYEFTVDKEGKTYVGSTVIADGGIAHTINNPRPDLKKEVKSDKSDNYDVTADYSIGDTITYKLTVDIPENIKDLTTFKLTDTPCDKIALDPLGTESTVDAYHTTTNSVTLKASITDNVLTIDFKNGQDDSHIAAIAGEQITITYTAKLLEGAKIGSVGNKNTAKLEYTNTIKPASPDAQHPNKDLPETEMVITDDTSVLTFEMDLKKTFSGTDVTNASVVEFNLYRGAVDTANVVYVKGANGEYSVVAEGTTGETTVLSPNSSTGKIILKGLENADYNLVEIKTAPGYNLLAEKLPVAIHVAYKLNGTGTDKWASSEAKDGSTIKHHVQPTDTLLTSADTPEGKIPVSVQNRKGFVLPQTGSMGYLLFCTAGLVLVGAGAAMIFSNRKKVIR